MHLPCPEIVHEIIQNHYKNCPLHLPRCRGTRNSKKKPYFRSLQTSAKLTLVSVFPSNCPIVPNIVPEIVPEILSKIVHEIVHEKIQKNVPQIT